MAAGKKRPEAHIVGELGVDILKRHLPVEWVVREYTPDYGIDLSIEIFARDGTYVTKGAHVFVQVKTTQEIKSYTRTIQNRSNVELPPRSVKNKIYYMDVIRYNLDTDFLTTVERMGSGVPVLLCVVELKTQEVFFVCLSDYIEKILIHEKDYSSQKCKTVYIPMDNILDDRGISIIEWYAKRPRLYALFNKLHYQSDELQYVRQYEINNYIDHFIRLISRFDVWEEPIIVPNMKEVKEDIDYYIEHGITQLEEKIIISRQQSGEDVDAELWEASYCDVNHLVSFREAQRVQGLHRLWQSLSTLGHFFEEMCKEYFLPTPFWCSLND